MLIQYVFCEIVVGMGQGKMISVLRSSVSHVLVMTVMASLLAGCSFSAPANDTFALSTTPLVQGKMRRNLQILIPEPTALKALDSEQVVVRVSAAEIRYLGGAQWSDRLPKMVQAKLVQAFEKSGTLGGVGRPGEGLAIDQQVITNISSFEILTDGGDAGVVEISAKILNDRNGTIKAQKSFRAVVASSGQSNQAYIAALDTAFANVTAELVTWALGSL